MKQPRLKGDRKVEAVDERKRPETTTEKIVKVLKYLGGKLEALAWVLAAVAVTYYTNFVKVMFSHKGVNKLFLDLFLVCFGFNTCLTFYIGFILPLKGIEDYEKYLGKRVTYIATSLGVLSFFSIVIAVWSCWGFWTIPMIFILFMGFVLSSQFLPNSQVGSLLSALIFLAMCFSHYLIDHEGMLHYSDSEEAN